MLDRTIVDASFVAAPRQRNSREEKQQIKQGERPEGFEAHTPKGRQKDCDARWTKKNKLRSRIRVRCEHVFGRMSQMAMDRLRTIGLLRAEQHNGLCNLVYNMDRYDFLCR